LRLKTTTKAIAARNTVRKEFWLKANGIRSGWSRTQKEISKRATTGIDRVWLSSWTNPVEIWYNKLRKCCVDR